MTGQVPLARIVPQQKARNELSCLVRDQSAPLRFAYLSCEAVRYDARYLFNLVNHENGKWVSKVPIDRARGPVIDDGPGSPARIVSRHAACNELSRLVHDQSTPLKEIDVFYDPL